MADIPCIYDMSLISEKDTLKEDILNGRALDVLLILLSGSKTVREISKELNIPSFSIQLYVNRLLENNLIKIKDVRIIDGRVEKSYELATSDIEILNNLKNSQDEDKRNIEVTAQHFASLSKTIIKNIVRYREKPHKIKAYFIKGDEETMNHFKEELNQLFEKFQALENLDSCDTYGFVSIFAPYSIND